jgi:hypothetical protein
MRSQVRSSSSGRKEVSAVIGVWQTCAGTYLIVAGAAMLAMFGIPLLVAPMSWARLMRWEIPPPGQLVTFLGRSLGLFICVVAAYAFKAAATPQAQPFFFQLMLWLFVGMIGLHVYGAIKRAQPITETIEIGLWVVLLLVTLAFYPAG